MTQCCCCSAALSTKSKSPKSVKSRNNRDIKIENSRVKIKLRCFRQSRGTFTCQKGKMSLEDVFPCAWSEMCNSLVKHSDPERIKIMRAVSGLGSKEIKASPCSRVGWEGAAKGCSVARWLLPAPASSVRGWLGLGGGQQGNDSSHRAGEGSDQAARAPQGCQGHCPHSPAECLSGAEGLDGACGSSSAWEGANRVNSKDWLLVTAVPGSSFGL